jgi:hemoglobin-like flavoprotein
MSKSKNAVHEFGTRLSRHEWQVLLERWERLQPYADRIATAFFDTLFAREPAFARVFGGASLETQFLRFAYLLTRVVSAEDDSEELGRRTEEIVHRYAHADCETPRSLAIRAAIDAMLREVSASNFTPGIRASWKSAHAAVNGMLRGTTWSPTREFPAILNTALRAELAADQRSRAVDELMNLNDDAEAA